MICIWFKNKFDFYYSFTGGSNPYLYIRAIELKINRLSDKVTKNI